MGRLFESLFVTVRRTPWVWCALLLAVVAGAGWSASHLTVEEDITRTLPQTKDFNTYQKLYRNSSIAGNMVLAIGSTDSADAYALMDMADTLFGRMGQLPPGLVKEVMHNAADRPLNLAPMLAGLPFYLTTTEMDSLQAALTEAGISKGIDGLTQGLSGMSSMVMKDLYAQDPLLLSAPVLKHLDRLRQSTTFELKDGYFFTRDGSHILLFVSPANAPTETAKNAELVAALEVLRDSLVAEFPHTEVLLFGGPVIAVTNARQIRSDATLAGMVGTALILLLLMVYFRSLVVPFIFLLPAAFGMLCAAAIIQLVQGSISALALGAGTVVLGIAMDYSFHYLNHYRHTGSVEKTLREVSFPLMIGSATTVFALFALRFLHSDVLRDLGTFGALTLAFTALFVLTVMPHLSRLLPAATETETDHHQPKKRRALQLQISLVAIVVITVGLLPFSDRVGFENDLNKINYFPEHLQKAQDLIAGPSTEETVFVSHTSTDILQALTSAHRCQQLVQSELKNEVNGSASVADLFPDPTTLAANAMRWDSLSTIDGQRIMQTMAKAGQKAGFDSSMFRVYGPLFGSKLNADAFLIKTLSTDPIYAPMYFTDAATGEHTLITTLRMQASNKDLVYVKLHDAGFDIVARASMAQALVSAVSADLNMLLLLTGGMVFLVLLLTYGRFELAVITFLPMVISWVWILGICGLFGIKFNMVNVLITTFIFGLGDDFAIFITDGFLSRFGTGVDKLRSYRSAILLSAITTIIGTGVLIFAEHPALKSIAILSVTGMVCVLVVSLLLQPVLFEVFIGYRQRRGLPPLTFLNLFTSLVSFGWFLIGCVLLSVVLMVVIPLPIPMRYKQRFMNTLISHLTLSVVQIMIHAKREIINPDNLSRPAIIIANHNSFVDLLWIIGYSPKVLLVTNEWVWNSPFFGFFIRYVDYIRAKEGRDFSLDMIRRKVDEGYSIVIFPEGTRSTDGRLGRFKKGAFFLAEELGLDILPLVTHGLHHVLPKGDFVVNRTTITMKFLPRISIDDPAYGTGYRERQKNISRLFKKEYEKLRAEKETVHFFSNLINRNYIYRGPVVEWYVRIKLMLENNFESIVAHTPKHGRVYDLGCGYGYLSLMLAITEDRARDVIGIDYDHHKVEMARNLFYKGGNVRFKQGDLSSFEPKEAMGFIIKDVLHYLRPADQLALLGRCVAKLQPGGRIIIRDGMSDESKEKHGMTRLTEVFSTRLFNFNRADHALTFPSEAMIRSFAQTNGLSVERIGNEVSSNVVLVLGKPDAR